MCTVPYIVLDIDVFIHRNTNMFQIKKKGRLRLEMKKEKRLYPVLNYHMLPCNRILDNMYRLLRNSKILL